MCVKLNSLFESEMKVNYVTQVLKQGINIKKETGNPIYCKSYLGAWVKIEIVIENLLNCWSLLL